MHNTQLQFSCDSRVDPVVKCIPEVENATYTRRNTSNDIATCVLRCKMPTQVSRNICRLRTLMSFRERTKLWLAISPGISLPLSLPSECGVLREKGNAIRLIHFVRWRANLAEIRSFLEHCAPGKSCWHNPISFKFMQKQMFFEWGKKSKENERPLKKLAEKRKENSPLISEN